MNMDSLENAYLLFLSDYADMVGMCIGTDLHIFNWYIIPI